MRTLDDLLTEIEDWVAGRRSYANLGPHLPYTPDIIAAMDAQEVVKLTAYARLRAELDAAGEDYRVTVGDDQREIRGY